MMLRNQSIYRRSNSTETVMMKIFNDITSAIDSRRLSVLCLMDISAAVDTVDHDIGLLFSPAVHSSGFEPTCSTAFSACSSMVRALRPYRFDVEYPKHIIYKLFFTLVLKAIHGLDPHHLSGQSCSKQQPITPVDDISGQQTKDYQLL